MKLKKIERKKGTKVITFNELSAIIRRKLREKCSHLPKDNRFEIGKAAAEDGREELRRMQEGYSAGRWC